jgi:uncharacterized membrane protein
MEKLTFGQRAADMAASRIGSWKFLISFNIFIFSWITFNICLGNAALDPSPFIKLNLLLSWLAGVQAPLIMISQNRQEEVQKRTVDSIAYIGQATYEVTSAIKLILEDQNKMLVHLAKEEASQRKGDHRV